MGKIKSNYMFMQIKLLEFFFKSISINIYLENLFRVVNNCKDLAKANSVVVDYRLYLLLVELCDQLCFETREGLSVKPKVTNLDQKF